MFNRLKELISEMCEVWSAALGTSGNSQRQSPIGEESMEMLPNNSKYVNGYKDGYRYAYQEIQAFMRDLDSLKDGDKWSDQAWTFVLDTCMRLDNENNNG